MESDFFANSFYEPKRGLGRYSRSWNTTGTDRARLYTSNIYDNGRAKYFIIHAAIERKQLEISQVFHHSFWLTGIFKSWIKLVWSWLGSIIPLVKSISALMKLGGNKSYYLFLDCFSIWVCKILTWVVEHSIFNNK